MSPLPDAVIGHELKPLSDATPAEIASGDIGGLVLQGEEHSIVFHIVPGDDPDNESGETLYGIALVDNDDYTRIKRILGVLEDEEAYRILVSTIMSRGSRPRP